MAQALPKARRVGGTNATLAWVLVIAILLLIGVLALLLYRGSMISNRVTSDAERDFIILSKAAKDDPKNPAIAMTLAETEYLLGRRDDALVTAKKAVGLAGEQLGFRVRYATLLVQEGELEQAVTQLEEEVELGENKDAEPYFLLAQIQMKQGDEDAGLATMEKALRIDPMAADMRATYASMLEEAGKKDKAILEYQAALRFLPGNEDIIGALDRLGAKAPADTGDPHGGSISVDGSEQ